jgi:hypothetical protein
MLEFTLQLSKKDRKASVSVAGHSTQADTVQYKNNEQYNTQKKNSNTEQYDVTEWKIIQKVEMVSVYLWFSK